jgi:hypothetical protein
MREEIDNSDPYQVYVFTFLGFDCQSCGRRLDLPQDGFGTWQWHRSSAEAARRAGWYVSPSVADGSHSMKSYCHDCATKKKLAA